MLAGPTAAADYPDKLWRVRFKDQESGKDYTFLTNDFVLSALTIAKLYKHRWQVEIFFKSIKQHLRIKAFYGRSPNAVKTQIWTAISVYVLGAIVRKRLQIERDLYTLLQILSVSLFENVARNEHLLHRATLRKTPILVTSYTSSACNPTRLRQRLFVMTETSREHVRKRYAQSGVQYDQHRYGDPRGRLLSDHNLALFFRMLPPLAESASILEVGAGTGRFTVPILARGHKLIATDINETMLEQLRNKLSELGLWDRCTVQNEDIFNLSFPDASFDFVLSFNVIPRFMSLEDQRAAIHEVARTLKPGGWFFFNYRNRHSLVYRKLYRGHAATPNEIEEILSEACLHIVSAKGKMLLSRTLINIVPRSAAHLAAALDRRLWNWGFRWAWDVFVIVEKSVA